ncbi:hypothetical protein [Cytobacillus oceanisediminis]|uniref:hypothetical protein n=1 Tax=Cytobacillus oceanisediminis TaxID=665099 RepID=UPI001FB34FF2|nr:hypothetical protein [Cytobacillus oceanisediminis]UOE58020.1 hypothetical protein IRB79_27535 [Cytobacillus oceanisediminis]
MMVFTRKCNVCNEGEEISKEQIKKVLAVRINGWLEAGYLSNEEAVHKSVEELTNYVCEKCDYPKEEPSQLNKEYWDTYFKNNPGDM